MKRSFLLLALLLATSLFAYTDKDLDGVDDAVDKCPNTPFMDIVDINGCTKKSLISPHHYDIIVGVSYSAADYNKLNRSDTFATSLQADYYYKNFSLQASTSYYTTSGGGYSSNGFYDSFIGASYRIKPTKNFKIYLGAGVVLPTYDTSLNNNNTDYKASVSASYYVKDFNFFGGYSYTIINDDDVVVNGIPYTYQNTSSINGGIGYYVSSKLYMSASYYVSDSIYTTVQKLRTASLYGYYTIDKHWFTTFSYARGLSDSATDNYLSLRLGYYY